jgi:hypothetical protein
MKQETNALTYPLSDCFHPAHHLLQLTKGHSAKKYKQKINTNRFETEIITPAIQGFVCSSLKDANFLRKNNAHLLLQQPFQNGECINRFIE